MFAKLNTTLQSLISEEDKLTDDLVEEIKKEDFKLSKENRNYLRKSFLKILKRTLVLKIKVKNNLKIQEEEEMARQAKIDDVSIPVFDGSNFSSWKFRLTNILEYKECHEPVIRERTDDNEAAWKKMDLKAKTILISALSDKQLEYISECKTTYEIMSKLEKMYSTQSTSLQIINRAKLEDVKLKNYDSIEEFFIAFEKAYNELKSAGATVTEEEKMRYLIKALPPNYCYIGDFIDLVPKDQRTVEYVKSKIKEKNLSKSDSEKKTNVSTFSAKTKGECYQCGKPGHHQRDCWHKPQGSQGRGFQHSQGRGAQGNSRGYRGSSRSRGRGASQRGYGRGRGQGHQPSTSSSEQHQEFSSESWSTQVVKVNMSDVAKNICMSANEIEWLLDSGCTDHIINNEKYFCKYVNLRNPIDVKLPDGKNLKATKLGTVKTVFKSYYNEVKVDLKNVYFVDGIQKNLLSISKITESSTIVAREQDAKIYNKDRKLIAVANKIDGLYIMKSCMHSKEKNDIYANAVKLTEKEKWHRALGHVNFQYLNKLVNGKLVEGLPEKLENSIMKCANCIQSKMANVPFENERTQSKEILELIHTDLNGPHSTTGYGGEKYFLTFIDYRSKCAKIYCINSKNRTANYIFQFGKGN